MPRIDPEQLLKCLSILLSSNGGVRSIEEVIRLVTLMERFSKKLVSKCIYINILASTETEILGSFMTAGGWKMTFTWLNEAIVSKNWPLVEEILKLLFLCPVDVERLKSNAFPKKVKALSKDARHPGVQYLATCLVERWLKLVKGEVVLPLVASEIPVLPIKTENRELCTIEDNLQEMLSEGSSNDNKVCEKTVSNESEFLDSENASNSNDNDSVSKQEHNVSDELSNVTNKTTENSEQSKKKSDHRSSSKKSSHSDKSRDDKSDKKSERRSSSSSRSSSHSSHKSRDHDKKYKVSSKKDSHKDRSRDKEKERSKDKSSDRHSKDREKHKSNDSKSHSEENKSKDKQQSSSRSSSEKSSHGKLQTVSISELGKIPKKKSHSDDNNSEVKKTKHSISIEVRKSNDSTRPQTVKKFHSKFRSHGLEEEAKPPPPRGQVKKPPTTIQAPIPKRTSPMRLLDTPPEKKPKISEIVEKPGAIKLIPPKPKPAFLQESVMFMDALTASATNKKEPKKKKRKLSISRETSQEGSPPTSPTTPVLPQPSPAADLPKSAPFRFYQDTLDSEENKEVRVENHEQITGNDENVKKESDKEVDSITMKSPLMSPPRKPKEEKIEESVEVEKMDIKSEVSDGTLKSILTIAKSKGVKKSLRWRDTNLEEIQYFELDENERVNVTRTFLDMKQMERVNEREAFQKARNLINDDLMGEQTVWRPLIPIDAPEIEYGKKSREKDVQLARQKTVLQCLYLNKTMVPDSAAEPDHEQYQVTDPVIIPLDDISGGSDNVEDLSDRPWPEPKSYGPPLTQPTNVTPNNMYNQIQQFGPPGFQAPPMPGAVFPPGPGGEWSMNGPNMMMPNGLNCPPEMFMGPGAGPVFQPTMNGDFSMMDNMNNVSGPMFNQGFPGPMGNIMPNGPMMNRPIGPSGPNGPPFGGFGNNRGNSNRGSNVNRGGGGSWRGNWNGPPRGGGNNTRGNSKRCIHFQKKGYCRQENNCHFAHY